MPPRSSLVTVLAFGALGLVSTASAAPYLVYEGTIAHLDVMEIPESTALTAKINANAAKINALPVALRNRIHTYVADSGGTISDTVFMVTDSVNVANFAVVVVDPTSNKVAYTAVSGSSPTNFISGFDYTKVGANGGLGVFQFTFSHSAGIDAVTGQPASYIIKAFAAGPINDTTGLNIVPARPAVRLRVVSRGVLKETLSLPAIPAIPAPVASSGHSIIASMAGTVQGTYFDETSAATVGATTDKGTIALTFDSNLTSLANSGGGYEVNAANIGFIQKISGSNVAAFEQFIKSIIDVYPPPLP